jgi:hypothetical protein
MAKKVATINIKTYEVEVFDHNASVGKRKGTIAISHANEFVSIVKSLQKNDTEYQLKYVR